MENCSQVVVSKGKTGSDEVLSDLTCCEIIWGPCSSADSGEAYRKCACNSASLNADADATYLQSHTDLDQQIEILQVQQEMNEAGQS